MNTIGGLRDALLSQDQTWRVMVDGVAPTALSSYRGYYDQLAIECTSARHAATELDELPKPFEMNLAGYGTYTPGHNEVSIKADPVVADLVQALDLAVGAVFEGYKGGQYAMRSSTTLWASEYGRCEGRQVVGFAPANGTLNLITKETEGW
ncbi:MAG: hypothetical protein WC322_02980 [Candidatus Paceibacterota bacterium]|jgi:hypothetical protein